MNRLKRNQLAGGAVLVGLGLWGCSSQVETGQEDGLSQKGQAASLAVQPKKASASKASKTKPAVSTDAARTADGRRRVWVVMKSPTSLGAVKAKDWKARGQAVHQTLTKAADGAQASLKSWLTARKVEHRSFWAVNTVLVVADDATVEEIKKRSDVQRVIDGFRASVPQPNPTAVQRAVTEVEWNIQQVRAPEAWADFGVRGEGVVVATIDTGAEYTHAALANNYRGRQADGTYVHDYNWHDPSGVCGDPASGPCDNAGHGTHTMGTIAGDDGGDNQIGVAPGATWITAKGCEDWSCSDVALLSSAQWMLAPTNLVGEDPRPELRPHLVSNSWGGGGGDTWYQEMVQAWAAAGIFPVFANGNSGDSCGSSGSPGDYPESYAVGAYDAFDTIAGFSSRGESAFGVTKPNISAPGVDVRSSVPGGGYDWYSGTSMATPHVAGAVALLWSAAPALQFDVDATRAILNASAIDHEDLSCGGTPENNNVWGEGSLDVYAALSQAPIGPTGWISGNVTNTDGAAIATARISVTGPQSRKTATNRDGFYSLRLPVGNYALDAQAFGYLEVTADDLVVQEGETNDHPIVMEAAPTYQLDGVVVDTDGAPILGAQVSLLGTPLPTITTDASGRFDFGPVPQGSYTLSTSASGCYEPELLDLVLEAPATLETDLAPVVDGYGYQCRPVAPDYIAADQPLNLGGDDNSTSLTLPFPVTYYGQSYDSINVDTNGYISFVSSQSSFGNEPVPSQNPPNGAIFALWTDLVVDNGGQVLTATIGDAPNRKFVIEWRDVPFFQDFSQTASFEIVLQEGGGVVVQYGNLNGALATGRAATAGIEDAAGTVGLQYSYNQPVLRPDSAIIYEIPHSGFVQGLVIDANDELPLAGVSLSVVDSLGRTRSSKTDKSGSYRLQLTQGPYAMSAELANYETASATVAIAEGETVQENFSLKTARVDLSPRTLQLLVPTGESRTRTLVLGSTGSLPLEYSLKESGGGRQGTSVTKARARSAGADPQARTTQGLFGGTKASVSPMTPGDVLFSFPAQGLGYAWGIGQAGNLWLSDISARRNVEFTDLGVPTGVGYDASYLGEWPADMAFDTVHQLMCQVAVGGDNGIHCWDRDSGDEAATIAGNFSWTATSQRGLAYKPGDDSFFIGGWNEGIVYNVAGLSSPTPGQVLSSCQMADGSISGLSYNEASDSLWVATNSPDDTLYQINPYDCTVLSVVARPSPNAYQGAGLDLDAEGNLWALAQSDQTAYLIESGVPLFSDVPWLTVAPVEGTLASGSSQNLTVTVDTAGLTPGLYLASLFVQTNAGREPKIKIPVSLVVSGYVRGVEAGGKDYVDSTGETWLKPQAYSNGQWGYLQKGKSISTKHDIEGATDPLLYQTQQQDPYAYRFDTVPNGIYEVDLRFAELESKVGPGKRLFDVIIEDTLVLPAHDIAFEVGKFTAEDRRFFIPVTDGRLDVRLVPRAGSKKPVVNALRVAHRPDR